MEKQQSAALTVAGVAIAVWALGKYPFITLLVLGSLALLFLLVWFSSLIFVDEDDVLSVLSTIDWRTAKQIEAGLRRLKRAAEWQSVCGVHSHLRDLVCEGVVEEQEKELTPAERAARKGQPEYEYRRKSDSDPWRRWHKKRVRRLIPSVHTV